MELKSTIEGLIQTLYYKDITSWYQEGEKSGKYDDRYIHIEAKGQGYAQDFVARYVKHFDDLVVVLGNLMPQDAGTKEVIEKKDKEVNKKAVLYSMFIVIPLLVSGGTYFVYKTNEIKQTVPENLAKVVGPLDKITDHHTGKNNYFNFKLKNYPNTEFTIDEIGWSEQTIDSIKMGDTVKLEILKKDTLRLKMAPKNINFYKRLVAMGEEHKVNAYTMQISNVTYLELKDNCDVWNDDRKILPVILGLFALAFFIGALVTQVKARRG